MRFTQTAEEYRASADALQRAIERYEKLLREEPADSDYLAAKTARLRALRTRILSKSESMRARAERLDKT